MRSFIFVWFILFSTRALSVEVTISGICDEYEKYIEVYELENSENVLSYTIKTLELFELEYVAYDNGISSVFNSPTGMKALEYISEKDMRSYGWCYHSSSIEGLPSKMPDEVIVRNSDEKIHWFYGYAEMKDGEWIKFCEPVFKSKPEFICPK